MLRVIPRPSPTPRTPRTASHTHAARAAQDLNRAHWEAAQDLAAASVVAPPDRAEEAATVRPVQEVAARRFLRAVSWPWT